MKQVKSFFLGAFLSVLGLVLFLQKLTFNDPSNKGLLGDLFGAIFGNTSPKSVSGIMVVVICVALLAFGLYPNILTATAVVLSILIMVFTIVASLSITIASMSGLELGIILTMLILGIGVMFRSGAMLIGVSPQEKSII